MAARDARLGPELTVRVPRLTRREHVLRAVEEYDRLGGDAFRERYGFGAAHEYFLVINGRYYDSKAIAGVAHGLEHPEEGFLKYNDFRGGRRLQRRLEELGFTVEVIPRDEVPDVDGVASSAGRNPPWERDERILALDIYLRHGMLSASNPVVQELSDALNALPLHSSTLRSATFRNANAVALKLANFAALDPGHSGAGMSRAAREDRDLWTEFEGDPEQVAQIAAAIRIEAAAQRVTPLPEADREDEAPEGRLLYRRHRMRERNPAVVRRKKEAVLRATGRLACEVCSFDFAARYGELGAGFCECHHLRPLSEVGEARTRTRDLAIVCSNCHRMLHRRGTIALEALRGRLRIC